MKPLYIIGDRSGSEPVLITIEPIDEVAINESFYNTIDVYCGKIVKITNITEKIEYFWTNLKSHDRIKIQKGQFFLTDTPLKCYPYKVAALETAEPAPNFSGLCYQHYPNGDIKSKRCYFNGKIIVSYTFRNDIYNTISETATFKNGKPEVVTIFNESEMMIGQKLLTSNGKIFKEYNY